APFVPPELRGQHVVGVIAIAVADPGRGEELFRPLREFGPPALDHVGPMPYTAVQQLLDPGNPPGLYNYWKAELVPDVGDELIDLSIAHAERMGRSHSVMLFQPLGGEIAKDLRRRECDHRAPRRMDVALHRRVGDARGNGGGARLGQELG